MKILIIDDNCIIRELLASILAIDGHKVICAENGYVALQKVEQEYERGQFDVVITDYNMPVMNGIEFLGCFKIKWPAIPVIVMTACTELNEHQWRNLGALDVIYKPVTSKTLLLLLEKRVCGKMRVERQSPVSQGG